MGTMAKTSRGTRGNGVNSSARTARIEKRVLAGNDSSTFKAAGKDENGNRLYKDENGYTMKVLSSRGRNYATLSNSENLLITNGSVEISSIKDAQQSASSFAKKYNLKGLKSNDVADFSSEAKTQISRDVSKLFK